MLLTLCQDIVCTLEAVCFEIINRFIRLEGIFIFETFQILDGNVIKDQSFQYQSFQFQFSNYQMSLVINLKWDDLVLSQNRRDYAENRKMIKLR